MRIKALAFAAFALGGCTPAAWQPIPLPAPTDTAWVAPPGKVRLLSDRGTLTGDGITLIRDTFWVARMGASYTSLPRQDARAAEGLSNDNRTGLIVVAAVVVIAGVAFVAILLKGISDWDLPCTAPATC